MADYEAMQDHEDEQEDGDCQYPAFRSLHLFGSDCWSPRKTCFATSMIFAMMAVSDKVETPQVKDMSHNARPFFEVVESLRNLSRRSSPGASTLRSLQVGELSSCCKGTDR